MEAILYKRSSLKIGIVVEQDGKRAPSYFVGSYRVLDWRKDGN